MTTLAYPSGRAAPPGASPWQEWVAEVGLPALDSAQWAARTLGCTPPTPPEPETPMPAPTGYVDIKPTDDPETRRVKQAHNLAVNLDWTATTESERREAAAARQRADELADARLDALSPQVDRSQDEANRLYGLGEQTGRWEDRAAALRAQDEADRLHGEYSALVEAQNAESDRRRAENLRRYREHRDNGTPLPTPVPPMYEPLDAPSEDGMDEGGMDEDISDGRFDDGAHDMPPPAAPYVPPRETTDPKIRTKWRVDWVRWLGPGSPGGTTDQRPPQAATTSAQPPGGTMSIESTRASIMAGHEVLTEVLAGLEQQHSSLEEVQNGLSHATQGSNQAEADQANAQLAEAITKVDEARQQAAQALQEFETVAQRL